MTKDEAQFVKGCIAGLIVIKAMRDGCAVDVATDHVVCRLREEIPRYSVKLSDGEVRQRIWPEMHSVAHLWATFISETKPESRHPSAGFEGLIGDRLARFLLASERLLDQMSARPDLAHADPWRCKPEDRARFEADEARRVRTL